MQRLFSRPMVLVVCVLALCSASCSSNNKGKIEGKWKSTTAIGKVPAGLTFAEFKSDGTMSLSAGPDVLLTAKYKLGTGDFVSLSDVVADGKAEKPGRVKVSISGDTMKWTENKTILEFVRDKGNSAPPVPESK